MVSTRPTATDSLPPADLAYISVTLKGAMRAMSEHDRLLARDCFEHYRREWNRVATEDPMCVAFTVHKLIDEEMQRMLATSPYAHQVKCRKGCAACCHMRVDIFPQEAALLRSYAREAGIEIDEARLQRQAATDDSTWHELPPEDRRCVFLDDDRACRVYEHRPGACRKYLVKTDPDRCDMDKYPGGQVGVVFSVQAEIIHSAAMTVYGAGSMADELLRAAEQFTRKQRRT